MMGLPLVLETIESIRAAVSAARLGGKSLGLVPTMGALHDGHVRLIESCRREAEFVVVSIFVNPTQFGPHEDFTRYPRTPDADRERCAQGGADAIFAPRVETMYPSGALETFVEVPGLSDVLEGASRPGHFRGVASVVMKLLQIVGPDLAVFGEKDYQQLQVLRRMVADLNVPVAVRAMPTVREPDGLAMSSRNRYLNPDERRSAAVLWRALEAARAAVKGGERDAGRVRQVLRQTLESEALARTDYAEVADAETLRPLARMDAGRPAVALLAVRIGPARLIDNALLEMV
jgi:pantoate--beta-alanine ligase